MRHQALFWWVVASVALMVIGAFGPWVKALGLGVSGINGGNDGWIVVAAAVIGGALFIGTAAGKGAGIWPLIAGVIGAATTIYDRHDISSTVSGGGPLARALVQIDWGLDLAMLASFSLAVSGIVWLKTVESEAFLAVGRSQGDT